MVGDIKMIAAEARWTITFQWDLKQKANGIKL